MPSLRVVLVQGPNSSQVRLLVLHQASQGLPVPLRQRRAILIQGNKDPQQVLLLLVSPRMGLLLVELQLPQLSTLVIAIQAMGVLPSNWNH